MDPSDFQPIPEDVVRDGRDRLKIETTPDDLKAEVEELVKRRKAAIESAKKPVTVSVAPSGTIRRNGPCPCGSGVKFKKCCLAKVREGQLQRLGKVKTANGS